MERGNAEGWHDAHWDDGINNTKRTSPGRPQNRDTRDLRNKISGSSGDMDLRNKISGNARDRDLRNRIGGSQTSGTNWENTPRNRNDGVNQWGGNRVNQTQKGGKMGKSEWDDADWDDGGSVPKDLEPNEGE